MKDVIHFAGIETRGNVLLHKFESGLAGKMSDIRLPASQQVVEADHRMAFCEQGITEMRPEKSSAAGNQGPHPYSYSCSATRDFCSVTRRSPDKGCESSSGARPIL